MKEKIIIAPGLNGNELMRSLALHGVNCIGMRICGAAELARLALMRSGVSISENFISAKEEAAIAADAINGESYFGKTSYETVSVEQTKTDKTEAAVNAADTETESSSDNLVIYFSRTGEQYVVGVIDKGNTAIVAEMIAEQTGAYLV